MFKIVFYIVRFDIKGCEVSRWTDPAPVGSQIIVVLKDLNFEGQYINLGKKRAGHISICREPHRLAQKHTDGPSLWIAWDKTPNEFSCLNTTALCVVCRPPTSLATAAGGDRHQLPPEAECVGLQPAFGSAAVTKRWAQPGSLFCFSHYENQNVSCLKRLSFLHHSQCANVNIC